MIRETRNSHQISPWVLIFQRMNNKWTLYLLLSLRPTFWFWWFMHEYPAVTLARWQPEKQNWKGEIKGSQEQCKRRFKASTAANNYLKASLCSLDSCDCPRFAILKSLHKPWTYLYNEPVVGLQNFVLSLIKGVFQPLCQHLHKTAGVDVVCWTDKPQYCNGKRNFVKSSCFKNSSTWEISRYNVWISCNTHLCC